MAGKDLMELSLFSQLTSFQRLPRYIRILREKKKSQLWLKHSRILFSIRSTTTGIWMILKIKKQAWK